MTEKKKPPTRAGLATLKAKRKVTPPKPPGKQIAVAAVMPANRHKTGMGSKKSSTSYVKGGSGNPSGRPKRTPEELDLIAACREKTPAALKVIEKLMDGASSDAVKLNAANSIIDRGFGRATTVIDAKITAVHETSIDELK